MTSALPDLALILPELILVCGAMALLMLGVFTGDRSYHSVSWISVSSSSGRVYRRARRRNSGPPCSAISSSSTLSATS